MRLTQDFNFFFMCCDPSILPGAKLHQSSVRIRCIEQGGVNYTLEREAEIPTNIAPCYQHMQEVH